MLGTSKVGEITLCIKHSGKATVSVLCTSMVVVGNDVVEKESLRKHLARVFNSKSEILQVVYSKEGIFVS